MRPSYEVTTEPTEEDQKAIVDGLRAYNISKTGESDISGVAVRLRDEKNETIGGLLGRLYYRWLFVQLLFVPEELRGQGVGTELMRKAEAFAAERGCIGVWLDSFTFQAPGFYRKLGYVEFGEIEDYPPGFRRLFFQKRL